MWRRRSGSEPLVDPLSPAHVSGEGRPREPSTCAVVPAPVRPTGRLSAQLPASALGGPEVVQAHQEVHPAFSVATRARPKMLK